jgi:citrate lyase beta subunit
VIAALREIDWGSRLVAVRINALETPFAYRDLLEVAEAAGRHIDSVVIPKVDTPADVHFVSRMLDGIERAKGLENNIGIEASIESATGLANINEIAATSARLETLVFGIADYSADVGAKLVSISGHGEGEEQLYPGHRWHFVTSRIVMAAKAAGLRAIDAPYGNFKNPEGLVKSATMACALGFDGKWAIHPDQLLTINKVFTPDNTEIELARRVLAAHDAARQAGRGAAALDGRMIDQATVRLARQTVALARHLGMLD